MGVGGGGEVGEGVVRGCERELACREDVVRFCPVGGFGEGEFECEVAFVAAGGLERFGVE